MPVPVGVAKDFIHEGCLSEQKYGKFAKRWTVLEKCKSSGCIVLSVYRFSEDEENPVKENFKHQYIFSENEFIGSIKGRLSSNRNSSFYWAIILKSEILQFQNKSLFVCENWNSKIRENINYFNWEVRTRSGFKSTNQEAILYLTDYLLAVCCSDLSKVICAVRLEDILLFYSDECRVSFRSIENGETNKYEVDAVRRSQAARIVEEVQARKSRREDHQNTDGDLSNAQPVLPVRSRKESFQVNDSDGSEFLLGHDTRLPLLTPPSTPGSLSPYMSSSPSVSPCPSPNSRKRAIGRASSLVPDPRSQSFLSNDMTTVANKLEVPGDFRLKRNNAFRRRRGRTAPNIMISSPVEKSSDENTPAVPERPAWTLRPKSHHLSWEQYEPESRPVQQSLSLRRVPLQATKSVGCAVCVDVCSCVIRGPVLPLPILRPQENNSDTSSLSSTSVSREDVLQNIPEEWTSPPSPNRYSLEVVRSGLRSLSQRIDEPVGPCVVCNGPCECNQRDHSLMLFMDFQTIDEDDPYVSMGGNGGPYTSMEGNNDLYFSSTDLMSTNDVEKHNDSLSFDERDSRKRPIPKVMKKGKPIPALRPKTMHNNQFVKTCSRNQRLSSESAGESNDGPILSYFQQSSKKEFTMSFDDLYQLANQDCQESQCVDCKSPHTWPGMYSPYVSLNGGRVKYTRMSSGNSDTLTGKTLFQLLFEYVSKKSLPVDNLNMKPSVWTHFLISFDCEQCENELKDWRGLAELMGLSANDMKIVEEQCRKSSRISSEFIMLYWANVQRPFLPYTRQNLLDVLHNLDRMDLVEIIQNTEMLG